MVWIIPATVSVDEGESVPIPTLPNLSSKTVESPIVEVLLNPVHLVSRPVVPVPTTAGLAAAGAKLDVDTDVIELIAELGISEMPARRAGLDDARRVSGLIPLAESAEFSDVLDSEADC